MLKSKIILFPVRFPIVQKEKIMKLILSVCFLEQSHRWTSRGPDKEKWIPEKNKTKMVPLGWNQGSRDLVTIEYHIPVKLHEVNFQQNSWRFPTWRSYLSKVLCRLKVCFHEGYLQSFRTNMNVCNTKRVSAKQNASNMKRQSARQNASNTKRLSARQKRLSARQKRLSARQKRLQDRRGCRTEEAVC